ncbi:MAG: molybdenum cofactor biosynthesis protein MoaB [Euryarchaeota archaeon]|nr:molybdenum cofactor biosynthesis protein MoaB [Euryarchaeota archaeon]
MLSYKEHKEMASSLVKCAIVTISDSKFRNFAQLKILDPKKIGDVSGKLMKELLEKAKFEVVSYSIVPDEKETIKKTILKLIDSDAEAIITTGGTGITSRDITIETLSPMFQKELPGVGELFRSISYAKIGSAAILSRATAGTINNKIIICLPGSPNAVELALTKLIIPELPHLVKHVQMV